MTSAVIVHMIVSLLDSHRRQDRQ